MIEKIDNDRLITCARCGCTYADDEPACPFCPIEPPADASESGYKLQSDSITFKSAGESWGEITHAASCGVLFDLRTGEVFDMLELEQEGEQ